MRIVFIGTNWKFSIAHLNELFKFHEVIGIINSVPNSSPINETSFKQKLKIGIYNKAVKYLTGNDDGNNLRRLAGENRIPYLTYNSNRKNDFKKMLLTLKPDLIVIASMSQLLPEAFLALSTYGAINVHGSYLPDYKSKNPFFWQLYNADYNSGVTVHYVDKGVDSGNIIEQVRFQLNYGINPEELIDSLTNHGVSILIPAINKVKNNYKGIKQEKTEVSTYYKPFDKEVDYVKWDKWDIERTWHFLYAVQRWYIPPVVARLNKKMKIGSFIKEERELSEAGTIIKIGSDMFLSHPQGRIKIYLPS